MVRAQNSLSFPENFRCLVIETISYDKFRPQKMCIIIRRASQLLYVAFKSREKTETEVLWPQKIKQKWSLYRKMQIKSRSFILENHEAKQKTKISSVVIQCYLIT